jgi:hypothetical protein
LLGGVALACLVTGWLLAPHSAGQPQPVPARPDARYQAVAVGNYIVVSDSTTGESWTRLVQAPQIKDAPEFAWVPLGTPVKRK